MSNVMVQPPVVIIPDMSVEERASHITDDMIYDERELAFFKTRHEVAERSSRRFQNSLKKDLALLRKLFSEDK